MPAPRRRPPGGHLLRSLGDLREAERQPGVAKRGEVGEIGQVELHLTLEAPQGRIEKVYMLMAIV